MLSIEDELAQTELCEAMRIGNGLEVARRASGMVTGSRATLVRRACLECAAFCRPANARAVIEFFVTTPSTSKPSSIVRRTLANMVATVMAGIRDGHDASLPSSACRAAVDAILLMPGANTTVSNLSQLPARLGPSWRGVVALAREAVQTGANQEPLVENDQLFSLFEGRDPRSDGADGDDANDLSLKLVALWSYSRERPVRDATPYQTQPDVSAQNAVERPSERIIACDTITSPQDEVTCILATK